MKSNKNCCRIFPIVLILISTVLALAIWYFDEGVYQFTFLTDKNEIINFLGTVLFIAILPIGIFYFATEKEKYQSKAKGLSLLGFLPALFFLLFLVF
ncbi:MAG: hypothetical protein HN778_09880 [Prolixibacteraceae bacterium]|jgi:hypothetical protein|nr:hypothetical protein [Prolixibacteraceae bacterium]MBT6007235.1 hypothetical protein [Prolixibacteraceae bacterium]MBT6762941.1 hypothetical protein [Prolixibacteraceae bacterium]MBT7000262.1 hypothetical protein [Prolixibacteraceae bacterium]MBT7395129.1 hypothetical protein [Prolixibacteraceae bacterium]